MATAENRLKEDLDGGALLGGHERVLQLLALEVARHLEALKKIGLLLSMATVVTKLLLTPEGRGSNPDLGKYNLHQL